MPKSYGLYSFIVHRPRKHQNLYKKFLKDQRFGSCTDGPTSKDVPKSTIETEPPTQKPKVKCS